MAVRDRAWRCTARPRRRRTSPGRDFALPDDVKALVPAVLGHRILLDIDRQLRGATADGRDRRPSSGRSPRRRSRPARPARTGLIDGRRGIRRARPDRHRAGALLGAGGLLLVGVLIGHGRRCSDRCGRGTGCGRSTTSAISAPTGCRGASASISTWSSATPRRCRCPGCRSTTWSRHGAEIAGADLTPSTRRGLRRPARDVERRLVRARHPATCRSSAAGAGRTGSTSAELRVADLFAPDGPAGGAIDPRRRVPGRAADRAVRSAVAQSPTVGAATGDDGLYEEPSLFAGVRPYQPGDQLRRIHWKATARLGRPVSRRYDPAREREVLIALDMQTMAGRLVDAQLGRRPRRRPVRRGPVAGALVHRRRHRGRPRGECLQRPAAADRLPAAERGAGQVAAIADLLADVSPYRLGPVRALLAGVARRAPLGCSIIGLSARDPVEFLPGPPPAQRPGLRGQPRGASDRRRARGAPGRARSACRAPAYRPRSRLAGRQMRSNGSPERVLAVLAPARWRRPGSRSCTSRRRHLAPAAPGPLSLLAFAGAALLGLGLRARWGAERVGRPYPDVLAGLAVAVAAPRLAAAAGAVRRLM